MRNSKEEEVLASSESQENNIDNNKAEPKEGGLRPGPFTPRQEEVRERLIREAAAPGVLRWDDDS